MLGSNVKVHFAGSDGSKENFCALVAADTRYRLYSCYNYIVNKKPDDDFRLPEDDIILEQQKQQKHVIQDSGLFTLMFGASKGQQQTISTLTEWQDKLIAFVKQNHITASCVEIDCQKVLGPEEAWYFRQRMRDLLPENKQINVFHFEDGLKGLDRLIEFADYIAVSVPEWRIVKPATHKQDIRYITHYIKNKKPEIDIHLLGCTDFKIIRKHGDVKGGRWIWNNGSTCTSQIIDTFIYAFISFGLGLGWAFTPEGRMNLIGMMIGQYLLKACLALADTPFFYFFTRREVTGHGNEYQENAACRS